MIRSRRGSGHVDLKSLFHVIFVLMISKLEAANETPSKTFLISFVFGDVQIVVLLRVINFVAILAN